MGQSLTYDVNLYTNSSDIAEVKIAVRADFNGFDVTSGKATSRRENVKLKNKEYYKYNIGKYFLVAEQEGNLKIEGGSYYAYIGHQVVVNDYFFGATRRMQYEKIEVKAPSSKIKIKSLPKNSPEEFSGAIGDFTITAWLPPGHIIAEKEALAIVKISGEGFLADAEVPGIKSIFGKDAKMKEIRRSDNLNQKEGRLNSEVILECTFIPLSGKGELGGVRFVFFDPNKGKFRTVESEPLVWNNEDEFTPVDKSKLKVLGI